MIKFHFLSKGGGLFGGDGGTRTRVRKISSTDIYERSWSLISRRTGKTNGPDPGQPLGPESPLFMQDAARLHGTLAL